MEPTKGEFYNQDFLQEDEETCAVCREVKGVSELQELDTDERGHTAIVCNECIEKGWQEPDYEEQGE